jgi:hypothetical protein
MNLVSPQVVDALHELGFETPKVVCQQVTTLTLGPDSRRGEFQFGIPVLINAHRWQFEGSGRIEPMPKERFNLQFHLQFQQTEEGPFFGGRGGRGGGSGSGGRQGQLSGSIYTPLGHYTVMGTTTFVGNASPVGEEAMIPGVEGVMGIEGGATMPSQQQHLSAFVVYLDRAREFPSANRIPAANPDKPKTNSGEDDPFGG